MHYISYDEHFCHFVLKITLGMTYFDGKNSRFIRINDPVRVMTKCWVGYLIHERFTRKKGDLIKITTPSAQCPRIGEFG